MTNKAPAAVLDYEEDWSTYLAQTSPVDTISSSSWTASHGVTVDSDTNTTTAATVWISAGNLHKYCELVNTIVTAGGRTDSRTIVVKLQAT